MGGVLDCSYGGADAETDVSKHVGPIDKPFHKMTIKELEYTVMYDKRSFERNQKIRFAQRQDGVMTNLNNVSTGAEKDKESGKELLQTASKVTPIAERRRSSSLRIAEV